MISTGFSKSSDTASRLVLLSSSTKPSARVGGSGLTNPSELALGAMEAGDPATLGEWDVMCPLLARRTRDCHTVLSCRRSADRAYCPIA